MKLIAAVDSNWAIGLKNQLLVQIPADQKFFRQTTLGKIVVMGRRTLQSFPNGMPLKQRTNIVLSGNADFRPDGCIMAGSIDELNKLLGKYDTEDVYVIGGEKVYRELLPYCDTAIITKIDKAFDADAHFPDLDRSDEWVLAEGSENAEEQTYFDLIYRFLTYKRCKDVGVKSTF